MQVNSSVDNPNIDNPNIDNPMEVVIAPNPMSEQKTSLTDVKVSLSEILAMGYDWRKLEKTRIYSVKSLCRQIGVDEKDFNVNVVERLVELGKLERHDKNCFSLKRNKKHRPKQKPPLFKGLIGKGGKAYAFNYFNKTFTVYASLEDFLNYKHPLTVSWEQIKWGKPYDQPCGIATIPQVMMDLDFDYFLVHTVNVGYSSQRRIISTEDKKLFDGSCAETYLVKQHNYFTKKEHISMISENQNLKPFANFYKL